MPEFFINDDNLAPLAEKVVVVTGCSSGIGLATVELLLRLNAKVVGGDLNESQTEHANFSFVKTDVTSWPSLVALFKAANDKHGRIDHVFSNAGITGRTNYLEETHDENGDLQEPSYATLDIDLRGMINTSYLGLCYFRRQNPASGSIVCTASAASFQRFRVADYTAAKHGVLGWMRGVIPNIKEQQLAIRVNAIAPSWTITGMVPPGTEDMISALTETQSPDVVARSVCLLMADEGRQGQLIYSWGGRFMEIEEEMLLPVGKKIAGKNDEDVVIAELHRGQSRIGTE